MLQGLRDKGFDVLTRNHAEAILTTDFAEPLAELVAVLSAFRIDLVEVIGGGGGEAGPTQRLRRAFAAQGWLKHNFRVETLVDGRPRFSLSHEIDHVRRAPGGVLAMEIEWNNKDPFFDRDLDNFQRFHAHSAISLGIVITRGASLQDAFVRRIEDRLIRDGIQNAAGLAIYGIEERTLKQHRAVQKFMDQGLDYPAAFTRVFVSDKFGQASTHWEKLSLRVRRGVGNPCPLVLIGLPEGILEG
jgi:hypothetical protein